MTLSETLQDSTRASSVGLGVLGDSGLFPSFFSLPSLPLFLKPGHKDKPRVYCGFRKAGPDKFRSPMVTPSWWHSMWQCPSQQCWQSRQWLWPWWFNCYWWCCSEKGEESVVSEYTLHRNVLHGIGCLEAIKAQKLSTSLLQLKSNPPAPWVQKGVSFRRHQQQVSFSWGGGVFAGKMNGQS